MRAQQDTGSPCATVAVLASKLISPPAGANQPVPSCKGAVAALCPLCLPVQAPLRYRQSPPRRTSHMCIHHHLSLHKPGNQKLGMCGYPDLCYRGINAATRPAALHNSAPCWQPGYRYQLNTLVPPVGAGQEGRRGLRALVHGPHGVDHVTRLEVEAPAPGVRETAYGRQRTQISMCWFGVHAARRQARCWQQTC